MRSIFFRIYSGILCAVILIGSGSVVGYRYWNEDRLSQYLLESSRGTLQLIGEGLARHQDERRAQWLALSQRVTSLQIELITSKQIPDDSIPLHNATGNTDWRLKVLDAEHRLLLHRPDPNKDEWIRVILKEAGINEQLMRGTQLLLLNELGRVPKAERGNVLKRLQSQFSYPLQWLKKADINTNYLQQRALARGDTVVDFFTLASGQRAIRTLAPIGNSGDFLQLGPLPLFDSFPRTLILLSGLLALGLLAIACFLLVKPLER
ncbi:MAG: hypothetical protein KC477_16725, partial [Oceanospirillaceae bacterium]|nr:hypothetical protein [Oceanospirillaceae bacterium]